MPTGVSPRCTRLTRVAVIPSVGSACQEAAMDGFGIDVMSAPPGLVVGDRRRGELEVRRRPAGPQNYWVG
jgi:hypothetical protein